MPPQVVREFQNTVVHPRSDGFHRPGSTCSHVRHDPVERAEPGPQLFPRLLHEHRGTLHPARVLRCQLLLDSMTDQQAPRDDVLDEIYCPECIFWLWKGGSGCGRSVLQGQGHP